MSELQISNLSIVSSKDEFFDKDKRNHEFSKSLSQIYLQEENGRRVIRIQYTPINKYNQPGNFMIAEKYLQELLELDTTKENFMQDFLIQAGRLAHIMAHIFPFKLGSAGITEWLLRAAAHSKGINLGEFNLSEGLS